MQNTIQTPDENILRNLDSDETSKQINSKLNEDELSDSKLEVPERELGDGASEDGEKSQKKKKKTAKKRSGKSLSSKSIKSKKAEESDADRSSNGSNSSSSSSDEEEENEGNLNNRNIKSSKSLTRPRTAIKINTNSKDEQQDKYIMDYADIDGLHSNDERSHEVLLSSSGRDTGLVREAPAENIHSPSKLSIQDNQNLKSRNSNLNGETSSDYSSGDDEGEGESKKKKKSRKNKSKSMNDLDEDNLNANYLSGEETYSDNNRSQNEGGKFGRLKGDRLPKHLRPSAEEVSEEVSESSNESAEGEGGETKESKKGRTKGGILRRKSKKEKDKSKPQTRKDSAKRILSGGPRKVQTMESNLKKRRPDPATEMSITRAMQTTLRQYSLERRLFQQLLDLKRMQIRNSRANEHVTIKKLVDDFNKDNARLGFKEYRGQFTFAAYEKYLYDQLRFLQSNQGNRLPRFGGNDDVDRLSRALKRSNVPDITSTLDNKDKTYRKNIKDGKVNLPKITPPGLDRAEVSHRKGGQPPRDVTPDVKKPLKVQLQHGRAKQQISLPTNFLDKSQKYQLTVSIQPSANVNKREKLNISTEAKKLTNSQSSLDKPSSAHSAPDEDSKSSPTPPKEIHSAPTEGTRTDPK
ncbi:hypothetical protein Anas_08752 [Armadillidium nasatum]|uniref:Uncharacterized protein n=1 Tax=Armadillidium nasatum TaxID=96803 RepID=A0A5N5TCB8_9CRUS|nr:hypothetical protein Anas_08752 [Armadillidium nasatum]